MEITWSGLAVESLSDILTYIQSFFGKRVSSLSHLGEVRCALYKQNHIYYLINDKHIEIILIWDGRQDPKQLQNIFYSFFERNENKQ